MITIIIVLIMVAFPNRQTANCSYTCASTDYYSCQTFPPTWTTICTNCLTICLLIFKLFFIIYFLFLNCIASYYQLLNLTRT